MKRVGREPYNKNVTDYTTIKYSTVQYSRIKYSTVPLFRIEYLNKLEYDRIAKLPLNTQ